MASVSVRSEHSAPQELRIPVDPQDGVRMTVEIIARHTDTGRPVINQYVRGPQVGKGQHGEVYLAWDLLHSLSKVAIKAVRRKNPRAEKMKKLRRPQTIPSNSHIPLTDRLSSTEQKVRKEIAIMKKLRDAHVVRLLEVIDDKLYSRIYMVMEFLDGGEVKWRDQNNRPVLQVDQTRRIVRDVILGLEYLHYQGIIHRDIKPANLMYTADRGTVKITDFGVSHFSYAQRLAAAGRDGATDDSADDPILMDESDLSRTAGTPAFMAPEVIWDLGTMSADGVSSMTPLTPPKRQITKAIDVWALGVTLYCLLFACTPFFVEDMNEYPVYRMICNEDWILPATMGVDRIPSGVKHPPRTRHRDPEGALVVRLLERLLEKDADKRITLDQVKRDPWFLHDIPNADAWLRETSPSAEGPVVVTEDEASDAMSNVRFRWTKRIIKPVSTFLRTVRLQRSFRSSNDEEELNRVGLTSAPAASIVRARSTSAHPSSSGTAERRRRRLAPLHAGSYRNESTPNVVSARSRSTERRPPTSRRNSINIANLQSKTRRRSETLLVPDRPQTATQRSAHSVSPTSSSAEDTPHSGMHQQLTDERSKNRFSLTSWLPSLRPSRHPSYGPAPHEASTSTSRSTPRKSRKAVQDLYERRSEEAFTLRPKGSGSGEDDRSLTAARRASSWGETADYVRQSEDVTSVHSADRADDMLDEEVMHLGAGGVLSNEYMIPMTAVSAGLTALRISSPPSSAAPLTPVHPQTERFLVDSGDVPPAADPALHDFGRHAHSRSHTTSPLTQVSWYPDDPEYEDDASSFFDRNSDNEEPPLALNTSHMYNDEDDESDDGALEVRRRRPSVSITMASPPPPQVGEES